MTTQTLPRPPRFRLALHAVTVALGSVLATMGSQTRARSRPVASHLRDHFYTIAGLGFISGAAFVHSVFTGLLVTGLMFLLFEWKVSE